MILGLSDAYLFFSGPRHQHTYSYSVNLKPLDTEGIISL